MTAVQTEYSLFERSPEVNGVLDVTRELGIEFVAYSPLGRGVLTGAIASTDDLEEDDFRRPTPASAPKPTANLTVVDRSAPSPTRRASRPGSSPWRGSSPGRRRGDPGHEARTYLEENVAAADVELTAEDLAASRGRPGRRRRR